MRTSRILAAAATGLASGTALWPTAAMAAGLEYGRPYLCNGERFVVAYCRGDDDGPLHGVTHPLSNYCNVTYIDRPRRNGFLPETGELRGDIIQKLSACGALQSPASAAPPNSIVVPGTGGSKVSLLRLGSNPTTVVYVDELSGKRTANAGVVTIWSLLVFPQGDTSIGKPGAIARWIEQQFDCGKSSFGATARISLDRQAKALAAASLNLEYEKVVPGTHGAVVAGIACGTGAAAGGPRLTSTMAAIEDAMKPASANALIDAWSAAYARKDYDAALAQLREYSQLYPQDANGYVLTGKTWIAKGDNARARTELLKVLAQKSATSAQLISAGELLVLAEDGKSATEAFRRGVQLPGEPKMLARGWHGFGDAQLQADRLPQATAAFTESLRLDPERSDAHVGLASVYNRQGKNAEELVERQAVVRLTPDDPWAQWLLGSAHAQLKQLAPALAAFDRAADLVIREGHSNDGDVLGSITSEYEKLGEWARAAAIYRVKLAAQPSANDPDAALNKEMDDSITCEDLGRALVRQKKYPDVVRLYLARGPCHGLVAHGLVNQAPLGAAYAGLGQPGKAIENLEPSTAEAADRIAGYESQATSDKLDSGKRDTYRRMAANARAEYAQDLAALGQAYVLAGRKADAQRTSGTLRRLDKNLAGKLDAQIAASP
ncbi:MAG: tetratricopeptide repeat protein [Steroidobacteraceae bacterium]